MIQQPSIRKLNLGCGEFKKEGYINVDYGAFSSPDLTHNLEEIPYPFSESKFDLIEADHVLEHLADPFSVMRKIHRIAKDKSTVIIRTPHFSRGFSHPEHKRGFDVSFPLYFRKSFVGGYQGCEFDLKVLSLRWFAQPDLKRRHFSVLTFNALRAIGFVIDLFANLSPEICSRIRCYWVGGFEEIEYVFVVKKC